MKKLVHTLFVGFMLAVILPVGAQDIKLPEALKSNSVVYPVKGRQGVVINQVISFGDFTTSKIKKGWTKTSRITSGVKSASKSSQKFSFTQIDPEKEQAEVSCLGQLSQAEIEIVRNLLALSYEFKNCFTGSVEVVADSTTWEFIIIEPDSKPETGGSSGFIRNGNKELIELFAITALEGKKIPGFLQGVVQGFEFRLDGQPIGAVSLYNKGNVVFSESASAPLKLVMASLSTALLVRSNLNEQ